MAGWWNFVDDKIQKAIEEGAFDNLAGAGQPLNLAVNPHEDPTMRSANRIMQQHGIAPDWIMERQALAEDIEKLRAEIQQAWSRYQAGKGSDFAKSHWEKSMTTFQQRVENLNKRILTYNLKAPTTTVHMEALNLEREIASVPAAKK